MQTPTRRDAVWKMCADCISHAAPAGQGFVADRNRHAPPPHLVELDIVAVVLEPVSARPRLFLLFFELFPLCLCCLLVVLRCP